MKYWYLKIRKLIVAYNQIDKPEKLSLQQIILDILKLKMRGVALDEYFYMEFYRIDNIDLKKHYLSRKKYYKYIKKQNPFDRRILTSDKHLTKLILNDVGIKVPPTYFLVGKSSYSNMVSDVDTFKKRICEINCDTFVIKKRYGSDSGEDVFFYKKNPSLTMQKSISEKYCLNEGNLFNFFKYIGDDQYICEQYIDQHDSINEINESSLNTVRTITYREQGIFNLLCSFIKFGRSGIPVDNFSKGGVAYRVDIENGLLTTSFNKKNTIIKGDTFFEIYGYDFYIPFWGEVFECSLKASEAFYHLGFLGFDVAITNNGPVLIEANAMPDWSTQYLTSTPFCHLSQ